MCKAFFSGPLRRAIKETDAVLRRIGGVTEFETDAKGLLRIQRGHATCALTLKDRARVARHAPVMDLHFWNEHLPPFPAEYADFDWTARVKEQLQASLHRLALYIRARPELGDLQALRVRLSIAKRGPAPVLGRLLAEAGFEPVENPTSGISNLLRFFEGLWMWLLTWTYNPRGLVGWRFNRTRREYWISRSRFFARYDQARSESTFQETHRH